MTMAAYSNFENTWTLKRVDVRTRTVRGADVAARVELIHNERGKITELAVGEGGVETALQAIAEATGLGGKLLSLDLRGVWDQSGGTWKVSACVVIAK